MIFPDPQSAGGMSSDVNRRLVAAIEYVSSEVIGQTTCAAGISTSPAAHALQNLAREAAVVDDIPEIRRLFSEHGHILTRPLFDERCHIVPWGAPDLTQSDFTLLQSAFKDDIGLTARLVAPSPQHVAEFHKSFDLLGRELARHLPNWWQELEALVAVILLAESGDETARFGGASAFAAWGAILINPANSRAPLPLALTLIHESSHLKLFYAYLEDEIVLNSPDDRYSSPLRRETRPMNGIFHATFVLARMILFLSDLIRTDAVPALLGATGHDAMEADLRRLRASFDEGYSVIAEHGVLTPKGAQILAQAHETVESCGDSQLAT